MSATAGCAGKGILISSVVLPMEHTISGMYSTASGAGLERDFVSTRFHLRVRSDGHLLQPPSGRAFT